MDSPVFVSFFPIVWKKGKLCNSDRFWMKQLSLTAPEVIFKPVKVVSSLLLR